METQPRPELSASRVGSWPSMPMTCRQRPERGPRFSESRSAKHTANRAKTRSTAASSQTGPCPGWMRVRFRRTAARSAGNRASRSLASRPATQVRARRGSRGAAAAASR